MTTDDPGTLTYTVAHEAWYQTALTDTGPSIGVHRSHIDGGVSWEFTIEEVGRIGVKVAVFDDAWTAFTEIPDLFHRLARLGRGATLTDVLDVLDNLGFRDITERNAPERYRKVGAPTRWGSVIRATVTYEDGLVNGDAVLSLQCPDGASLQWKREGGGWVSTDQLSNVVVLYSGMEDQP